MFMDRLLTLLLPVLDYIRRAILLSAISTVILSPNLFTVKIAAITMALELYGHFKTEKMTIETKARLYFLHCDLVFQQKETVLIKRYAEMLARQDK